MKINFLRVRPACRLRVCLISKVFLAILCTLLTLVAQESKSGLGLKEVASGFIAPVALVPLDGRAGAVLVADQVGIVQVLDKDGKLHEKPFLDIHGSLLFSPDDFKDAAGFLTGLKNHSSPVASLLWGRLSAQIQERLNQFDGSSPSAAPIIPDLLTNLNTLIRTDSLYDSQRFSAVTLSEETKKLLSQKSPDGNPLRLNRLLLEDAYRGEIAQSPPQARLTALNKGFDERGILGLALHPKFKENRKLYVFYSAPLRKDAPPDWDHTANVSEFKVSERDPLQVDLASERILLQIDKPWFNHNCGRLAFGPDGFLYIGVGDGGNMNDVGRGHSPQGNGQDLTTHMGKILRIDVNKGDPYSIPSDNPFVGGKARPEIFAYGLRNPWGISFDRGGTHELFASDVGQDSFEEINLIVKGGNYGWNIREGFGCFDPKKPTQPPEDCPKVGADGKPLLDPIIAYKNFKKFPKDPEARGTSVTGGYVYRGKALPQMQGRYIFADWSRNWIKPDGVLYSATRPTSGENTKWSMEPIQLVKDPKGGVGAYVWALGEDAEGELYLLTNDSNSVIGKTGKVYKLVPIGPQS